MTIRHTRSFLASALLATAAFSQSAVAAPKADLWAYWDAHDAQSKQVVDHSAWSEILDAYIRADGDLNRFDYGGVSDADARKLDAYLDRLTALDPRTLNRAEAKAYWINLYNAVTIDIVLDNYPVESIRKIKSGFFSSGPWDMDLATVNGKALTLNDIEHRILRPIWDDPKIHYGVNCASIGCPNLLTTAFTGDNVEDKLTENARAYVNSSRGAAFDGGDLVVSSIYEWFKVDFGGNDAGVIAHLRQYARPDLSARLADADGIDDDRYDWALNDAK